MFVIIAGVVVTLASEALAYVVLWLIAMFTIPGESVSGAVTFISYVLITGVVVLYAVQPVEVDAT